MFNNYIYLIISLALHLLLLLEIENHIKTKIPEKKDTAIKITLKKRAKIFKKKIKNKNSEINLSLLGIAKNEVLESQIYQIDSIKNTSTNSIQKVFSRLSNHLEYPEIFVKHNIKGNAIASIHFNKNGFFLRDQLKINSTSHYLKAHITMSIKKAMKNFKLPSLVKQTCFKVLYEFKLTTSGKDENKILNDAILLSRWKYGITSKGDKIANGINKGLTNLTNWMSLIEYIPESEKDKQKSKRELEAYERDIVKTKKKPTHFKQL